MKVLFGLLWYNFGFVGAAIGLIIAIVIAASSETVKNALDGIDGAVLAMIGFAILAAIGFFFYLNL
jgi:hypothetical protein